MESLFEILAVLGFFFISWLFQQLKGRMEQGGRPPPPRRPVPPPRHDPFLPAEPDSAHRPRSPAYGDQARGYEGRSYDEQAREEASDEGPSYEEGWHDADESYDAQQSYDAYESYDADEPYWHTEYDRDAHEKPEAPGGRQPSQADILRAAAEGGVDPWVVIADRLRAGRRPAPPSSPTFKYRHLPSGEEVIEEVVEEAVVEHVPAEIVDEAWALAPPTRDRPSARPKPAPPTAILDGGLPTTPAAWAEAAIVGAVLARHTK